MIWNNNLACVVTPMCDGRSYIVYKSSYTYEHKLTFLLEVLSHIKIRCVYSKINL